MKIEVKLITGEILHSQIDGKITFSTFIEKIGTNKWATFGDISIQTKHIVYVKEVK